MFQSLQAFYLAWKDTVLGKVVRDFCWSVLSSGIMGGLTTMAASLMQGVSDPSVFVWVFYTGTLVGVGKAILLFIGKYRDPSVPLTPTS